MKPGRILSWFSFNFWLSLSQTLLFCSDWTNQLFIKLGSGRWMNCKILNPDLGLWMMLEAPDQGLAFLSLFGYGQWSLIHPFAEFRISIMILRVRRTFMTFKSEFGALEDAGGSWPGFWLYLWFLFDLVLFCLDWFKLPWFWLYIWSLFYLVCFGLVQIINMNSQSKVHAF